MAITLEGGCRVSQMRAGAPVVNGTLRIWNQIGRATGAQAISLRILEFAPGLSPGIQNGECDEILYVLHSEREHPVRLSERSERTPFVDPNARILINDHAYDIGRDTGIYIHPGETFAIDNSGPGSIILVRSLSPDPDLAPQFVTLF